MKRARALLIERLGVGGTWGSIGRIAAFTAVWVFVIGLVVSPRATTPADRDIDADVPASPVSPVEYLGPVSRQDYSGFLPATAAIPGDTTNSGDAFRVAWVGGSETKWESRSVPGQMTQFVSTFGGAPITHHAYTIIAPRQIDALRAIDAALDDQPDALVVSMNPVWVSDEWSAREWPNLDVAEFATLFADPMLWPWAAALTSPEDVAWTLTRGLSPVVEAQSRLNGEVQDIVDALDVVEHPAPPSTVAGPPPPPEGDPRLPVGDPSYFWLVQEYGAERIEDSTERVALMLDGLVGDDSVARQLAAQIADKVESAGIPVFLYPAPTSPDSFDNEHFATSFAKLQAFWTDIAAGVDSPLVHFEIASMTAEFAEGEGLVNGGFIDVVHMYDTAPFAGVLAPKLCAQWSAAFPGDACA
ncbi:MAG TPA: hypothetical protein VMM60_15255 [Ilumatobacter sp.]|nr:hypothetical protein [Ilumatobacter sp.]